MLPNGTYTLCWYYDLTSVISLNATTHGRLDVRNAANYILNNLIGLLFFLQRGQLEVCMLPDHFPE